MINWSIVKFHFISSNAKVTWKYASWNWIETVYKKAKMFFTFIQIQMHQKEIG